MTRAHALSLTALVPLSLLGLAVACAAPSQAEAPSRAERSVEAPCQADGASLLRAASGAERVLLVRAAPVTAPRTVRDAEALREATRPAREDRMGAAPAPLRTDGRTFRVMETVRGTPPGEDVVRIAPRPAGCEAPQAGWSYLLVSGSEGDALARISGPDDPLVARVRALP